MKPAQRIVTKLPLTELWNADGSVAAAQRVRPLAEADIRAMLQQRRVTFVVANVGDGLLWVEPEPSFEFWKQEVKPHLVDPASGAFHLDDFPSGYAYTAWLWDGAENGPIVVLEKQH
jgi:hypothetical protein